MKLDELLNKVLHYRIVEDRPYFFQAEFQSKGRTITFNATQETEYADDDETEVDKNTWRCDFSEGRDGDDTYSVTGSGGEFEVFATLKAIIKEFFGLYKPKSLTFDAAKTEGSRADLYQKLFSKGLPPGYSLQRDNDKSNFNVIFKVVKT